MHNRERATAGLDLPPRARILAVALHHTPTTIALLLLRLGGPACPYLPPFSPVWPLRQRLSIATFCPHLYQQATAIGWDAAFGPER